MTLKQVYDKIVNGKIQWIQISVDNIGTERKWDKDKKVYENYTNRLSSYICRVAKYGKTSMCL